MDEGGAGATGGQGQTQPGGLPGPGDDGGDQQGEAEDGEAPRHRGQEGGGQHQTPLGYAGQVTPLLLLCRFIII